MSRYENNQYVLGAGFLALLTLLPLFTAGRVFANNAWDRPWNEPKVPIILDPYGPNDINWDKAVTDKRLKAIIHKSSDGLTSDSKFISRSTEAKKRGLLWGAYHLGRPGHPIAQADLLLKQAKATGANFLAIDLEGDDISKFMSLPEAEKFMSRIYEKTGRYPAVYVNLSMYEAISKKYDKHSVFAKGPLWIARFKPSLSLKTRNVWEDYTLWQFSSELNCSRSRKCLYRVPGTKTDMDVNVFNGDAAALKKLLH